MNMWYLFVFVFITRAIGRYKQANTLVPLSNPMTHACLGEYGKGRSPVCRYDVPV